VTVVTRDVVIVFKFGSEVLKLNVAMCQLTNITGMTHLELQLSILKQVDQKMLAAIIFVVAVAEIASFSLNGISMRRLSNHRALSMQGDGLKIDMKGNRMHACLVCFSPSI